MSIDAELLARVYLAMTGGQTALSLDADIASVEQSADTSVQRQRRSDLNLKVVAATAEESAAHEALLERMRDSGTCRWRDS